MSKMLHGTQFRLNAGTVYGKWKIQMELDIYYCYCLALTTLPFQYFEFQEDVETPVTKTSPVTEEPRYQYEGNQSKDTQIYWDMI